MRSRNQTEPAQRKSQQRAGPEPSHSAGNHVPQTGSQSRGQANSDSVPLGFRLVSVTFAVLGVVLLSAGYLVIDGARNTAPYAGGASGTLLAVGVVMAAPGYPGDYPTAAPITLGEDMTDTRVFHAGTAVLDDHVVTSGGRVLCVTALGSSVKEAQARAYERLQAVAFEGAEYRRDIGYRAIARETGS